MSISLLSKGIAIGGTVNTTPCYMEVTIDTRGADFLFVASAGGGIHPTPGPGEAVTDSEGNTWTQLPGYPGPGDGYTGITCSTRYCWCTAPLTSATHSFRVTTVNCGQLHGSIGASAWIGLKQTTPFDAQIWDRPVVPDPLALSLSTSVGLAISPFVMGHGDGNTGVNVGTVGAGWTLLDQTSETNGTPGTEAIVGLNLAYRVITAAETTTASWSYPGAVVSGLGGGIFAFLGAESPVPPVTTTYVIRRLRRFMLPWDDANRIKFLRRIEFIMQAGIGDDTTPAPQAMLRLSKDGGKTWGNEIQMAAGGPIGAFSNRMYAFILSMGRNWVAELTFSDPVDWQFLQCLVDYEEGTS